jgi:hypothetical protein
MIIKAKPLRFKYVFWVGQLLVWFLKRRFNKLKIEEVKIKNGHSYILMCNHFSFWDGFWGGYLCIQSICKQEPNIKGFYIMMLDKQLKQHQWLRRFGGFSVSPGTASMNESLDYIATILSEPGNVFLMYPQAKLESNHVRNIMLKRGVAEITNRITGNCQLLWSTNLVEYFESMKPSVYFHMLDCGTNHDFNFEALSASINQHHKASIQKQLRWTKE